MPEDAGKERTQVPDVPGDDDACPKNLAIQRFVMLSVGSDLAWPVVQRFVLSIRKWEPNGRVIFSLLPGGGGIGCREC